LTTSTISGAELKSAYLDYGTKVELDSDKVAITNPLGRLYLRLVASVFR